MESVSKNMFLKSRMLQWQLSSRVHPVTSPPETPSPREPVAGCLTDSILGHTGAGVLGALLHSAWTRPGVSGVHNPGWAGSCYVIPSSATAAHVPRPLPCLSHGLPAAGTLSGHPSKVPPPSGLHSSPANPQLPLLHWELMATVLNKVFLTLLVSVRIIFSLTCFLIRYPVSHKTN